MGHGALEHRIGNPPVVAGLAGVPSVFGKIGDVAQTHFLSGMVIKKGHIEGGVDPMAVAGRALSYLGGGMFKLG